MTKVIMHDLETQDTAPTAVILSLGSVVIDMDELKIVDQYYVNIDEHDCLQHGLTQSAATLKWWSEQSDEAKARLYSPDPKPLGNALLEYSHFWRAHNPTQFFGNGSDFDNVILQNAHKAVGVPCWAFWKHGCHRTLKNNFKQAHDVVRKGVHHNALDDAIFQAEQFIAIMRAVRNHKTCANMYGDALHRIAHMLDLPPGSDTTTACEARIKQLLDAAGQPAA